MRPIAMLRKRGGVSTHRLVRLGSESGRVGLGYRGTAINVQILGIVGYWISEDRQFVAVGVRLGPVTIGAHMQGQWLKEHVKRRLACMNYAFTAAVRCPRCKASLTEKLPSIALGFITTCPHCGLNFTEPM